MKNIKKWLSLALVTVCVAAFAACAKDDGDDTAGGSLADGSTIVSGTPNNTGGSESGSGGSTTPDDDVDGIEGTYIIYDLGDCPVATMPSNRQEVADGQAYTLYTPQVPILSNYEFVGWKNVITGEMFPVSGTFSGENNVYLEAVWVVYGPAV